MARPSTAPVKFGKRSYELAPQRIGRIRRKLPEALSLVSAAAGGEEVTEVGETLYEGIKVFVPDLAPRWELEGYMSESDFEHREDEDFEEEPYEQERDGSPTTIEIADLLAALFEVNGGQRLVRLLKNFVTPEMVQRQLRLMQAQTATTAASRRSRSLPPLNGESPSPSSTTTPPPAPETGTGSSPSPGS